MNIEDIILKQLNKSGKVTVADIVKATGFTRGYINRFFNELEERGEIVKIGKANQTRYIAADPKQIKKEIKSITNATLELNNQNISEDLVLKKIKRETGIFIGLDKNVERIVDYAFSEMLNNAIEHSKSEKIWIKISSGKRIYFEITDKGIGIFNNIMQKKNLHSEFEAIEDLLKGKQTTAPKEHSGEGIFFTSKVADLMIIRSGGKKIIYDNLIDKEGDIFVKDAAKFKGTKVKFSISANSKKNLQDVFNDYSVGLYDFGRTKITVKLFREDSEFISRSQARRITAGLDKFKEIILDFKNVETVGQGFADEIFRVWHLNNPKIKIKFINANKIIKFMINRALQS